MADVFLDNFSILNGAYGATTTEATKLTKYGAVLKIDQVNQNVFSNNTAINEGELLIFAAAASVSKFMESKNKKFNYLGVMQPGRYGKITGKLVDLDNAILTQHGAGTASGVDGIAFSIDLVVSNKK